MSPSIFKIPDSADFSLSLLVILLKVYPFYQSFYMTNIWIIDYVTFLFPILFFFFFFAI